MTAINLEEIKVNDDLRSIVEQLTEAQMLELARFATTRSDLPEDWNPAEDDGESRRLQVEFFIDTSWDHHCMDKINGDRSIHSYEERFAKHGDDKARTMRMLILKIVAHVALLQKRAELLSLFADTASD